MPSKHSVFVVDQVNRSLHVDLIWLTFSAVQFLFSNRSSSHQILLSCFLVPAHWFLHWLLPVQSSSSCTFSFQLFFLCLKVMLFLQGGNPFHESSLFCLSFNASWGCWKCTWWTWFRLWHNRNTVIQSDVICVYTLCHPTSENHTLTSWLKPSKVSLFFVETSDFVYQVHFQGVVASPMTRDFFWLHHRCWLIHPS